MPNALQKLFMPLYRLTHWPPDVPYQHANRQWMLRRILKAVGEQPNQTILEVGCGDGWVSNLLADQCQRVIGLDINPQRIEPPEKPNVLLLAAEAELTPIAPGSIDVIFSFALLEHIPHRVPMLQQLRPLLKPGGRMIHVVPTAEMKLLQWLGFIPDKIRRSIRSFTRRLAGQPKPHPAVKSVDGHETNNPRREGRRRKWYAKLYPRVHGEYDSNWQETLANTNGQWKQLFNEAGLKVDRVVPLGMFSPYFFGLSSFAKLASGVGLASVRGYVLRSDEPNSQAQAKASAA